MTRDEKIEEALNAMLEPQTESCRYDHHGLCQSHSLRRNDKGEPECEVALARAAIALPKGETKRDDAPPAPESKVEKARREFYEAASDYYAEHDGVEIAGAGLNRVRTFMDACARLYAAERDAGRGA